VAAPNMSCLKRVTLTCDGVPEIPARLCCRPSSVAAKGAVLMIYEELERRWGKRVTAKCHSATGILPRAGNEIWHSKTGLYVSTFARKTCLTRKFAVEIATPRPKGGAGRYEWRAAIKIGPLSSFTSGSSVRISIRRRSPGSSRVTVTGRDALPESIARGPLGL
jgi:hypothetical protein